MRIQRLTTATFPSEFPEESPAYYANRGDKVGHPLNWNSLTLQHCRSLVFPPFPSSPPVLLSQLCRYPRLDSVTLRRRPPSIILTAPAPRARSIYPQLFKPSQRKTTINLRIKIISPFPRTGVEKYRFLVKVPATDQWIHSQRQQQRVLAAVLYLLALNGM